MLDGSFEYDKTNNTTTKKIINSATSSRRSMLFNCNVQVECADALYIFGSRNTADTFFYVDLPYFNSDCVHYFGYTEQDFENLLKMLSGIKGKFMLSPYPSPLMQCYVKAQGQQYKTFESGVSVNAKAVYMKRKWEMITAHYDM